MTTKDRPYWWDNPRRELESMARYVGITAASGVHFDRIVRPAYEMFHEDLPDFTAGVECFSEGANMRVAVRHFAQALPLLRWIRKGQDAKPIIVVDEDAGIRTYKYKHLRVVVALDMSSKDEDGPRCRRVQVGTKTVPAREVPVYKIVCDPVNEEEADRMEPAGVAPEPLVQSTETITGSLETVEGPDEELPF